MRSYVLGALGGLTVIALFLIVMEVRGRPVVGAVPSATPPRVLTPGQRLDAPGPPGAPVPTVNPTVVQAERERQQAEALRREPHCRKIEGWYAEYGRVWNRQQGPRLTETEILHLWGLGEQSRGSFVDTSARRGINEAVYGCYGR